MPRYGTPWQVPSDPGYKKSYNSQLKRYVLTLGEHRCDVKRSDDGRCFDFQIDSGREQYAKTLGEAEYRFYRYAKAQEEN